MDHPNQIKQKKEGRKHTSYIIMSTSLTMFLPKLNTKTKRFLFFLIFLLPLFFLSISLIFLFFGNGVPLLCPHNEAICSYVQHYHSHPKTSIFLSLSIKETLPVSVLPVPKPVPVIPVPLSVPNMPHINHTSFQTTRKISRRHRMSLRILRPGPQSKQFAQRATEFFSPLGAHDTSRCNLSFYMTWIAPLEYFGARELFAIESLFKWHRDACLLIISTTMDSSKGVGLLRPFLDNGFRVAALTPDYEYLVSGTPAETWLTRLRKGEVDPGDVPIAQNLSNLLRLLILYKYGGVYIDTDVIVMKSFHGLRNCIGAQTIDAITRQWSRLNNAVMVFDRKHPLLLEFIGEFASTFDGSKWGHNGPYLVSRVVRRVAGISRYDVIVLPQIAFYPLNWSQIGGLFQGPTDEARSQWMREKLYWIRKSSFTVHLWNRESRSLQVEKGSILARILSDCCLFCNYSVRALLH